MQITTLSSELQKKLIAIVKSYPHVANIVHEIHAQSGKSLLVGGAVRDLLLDLPLKDLDIEVHGISVDALEAILKKFGNVSTIGKSFGVLRLHGLDIDWSLPRADSAGRKPQVTIDQNMPLEDAFRRRDATMNAMGIDLVTYQLIDPFNGQKDIQQKLLRAPDAALFVEDPLRFYRIMQFIGRFGFKPDAQLNTVCATMNLENISTERIADEFEKLLLKSKQPSLGIRWLDEIGRLKELLPELYVLKNTEQELAWHPEGDVFEHSMQALDAAAAIECENNEQRLILLYTALCHDVGKAVTTAIIDGRITSRLHEVKGVPIAKNLLQRMTKKVDLIDTVLKLVRYHMAPGMYVQGGARLSTYKKLADNLAPHTNLKMLANLAYADIRGRNPARGTPLTDDIPIIDQFIAKANEAQVLYAKEAPVLQGRDVIEYIKPGPEMGKLLASAYEIQLEEGIKDKDELKKRVLKR